MKTSLHQMLALTVALTCGMMAAPARTQDTAVARTDTGPGASTLRSRANARKAIAIAVDRGDGTAHDKARSSPRIIGGIEYVDGEAFVPRGHMAVLVHHDEPKCGASYVQPAFNGDGTVREWLTVENFTTSVMAITAAHCVIRNSGVLIERNLTLRGGKTRIDDPDARVQKVRHVIPHDGYHRRTLANDIAVLILDPPEAGREGTDVKIEAIALPTATDMRRYAVTNGAITLLGFGASVERGPFVKALRHVTVPYAQQNHCQNAYRRTSNAIPGGTFCAGYRTGRFDSCHGDSGGGAVHAPRNGSVMLLGVVSYGIGCARSKLQGVYTDVFAHIDFLERVARAHREAIEANTEGTD